MTAPSPPEEPAAAAGELMTWPDLLERPRPEPTTSIRYGEDQLQVVDLWLPAGRGPHPVVLMVHGGCWQTEIADRRIMSWIADDLRKRGIAVWNIDYRGVDRDGGGYPGTFLDAAAATDALRDAAPKHDLDISRLVAVGHSAGGHLALWLAGREARQRGEIEIRVTWSGASAERMERLRTEPIERALRHLPGVEEINSNVTPGESISLVRFSSARQLEEALAGAAGRLAALGFEGIQVSRKHAPWPDGSPLRSGRALPISTVVSLGGLPDLEEASRPPGSGCGTEVIAQLIGAPTPARQDAFADTSVPRLAPLSAKQVLINGLQDRIIPTSYAEAYATQMRAAGDEVDVRMINRTGHVELIAPETQAWAAAVREIESALGR